MTPAVVQLMALSAAFWVAFAVYRRSEPDGQGQVRFLVGLVVGAVLSHVGWALLYVDRVVTAPQVLLSPAGWSVLFVPLGPLVAAPWRGGRRRREQFLRSAVASLPLALATARLGCLGVGCCHGLPMDLPFGFRLAADSVARHPTALYDVAGLVLLHGFATRIQPRWVAPVVLGGFGLLRLAIEPWRAVALLGAPLLAPGWIAALWVGIALALVTGSLRRHRLS